MITRTTYNGRDSTIPRTERPGMTRQLNVKTGEIQVKGSLIYRDI